MPLTDEKTALTKIKEVAWPCEVVVVRTDSEKGIFHLKTTIPGKLLGKGGARAKELQRQTGWRMSIRPLTDPRSVAIDRAMKLAGCQRVEIAEKGPKYFKLAVAFDAGFEPTKDELEQFYERTGWQIKCRDAIEPLQPREVFELVASSFPQWGLVGYQDYADARLVVFSLSVEPLPKDDDPEFDQLCRLTGWNSIAVHHASEMPDEAERGGDLDPEGLMGLELNIIKRRCGACLGTGTVARPSFDLQGLSWDTQTCPSCHGAGDWRARNVAA